MDAPTAPQQPPTSPKIKPMTLALVAVGLVFTAALTLGFQQLPPAYRMWNVSVIGALSLFAAARLGFWPGVVVTAVAITIKDVCLYYTAPWWQPYPLSWLYFSGYALAGWALLRRSSSPLPVALGTSMVFFFISNFVSWLELPGTYERSLTGLLDSYAAGIPFYRGTLIGDVFFSAALFGAHAVLSRVYFPQEQVQVRYAEERSPNTTHHSQDTTP